MPRRPAGRRCWVGGLPQGAPPPVCCPSASAPGAQGVTQGIFRAKEPAEQPPQDPTGEPLEGTLTQSPGLPGAGLLPVALSGTQTSPPSLSGAGAAVMWPGAKGAGDSTETGGRGGRPDLGEYWGDSLGGAVGPLLGYFLCRGVEGGGGPTIISTLASKREKRHRENASWSHRNGRRLGLGETGGGAR